MVGLLGLLQPEARLDELQQAWDEVTNVHLEGEEEQSDTDTATQRKRPDAWPVS